MTTRSWIRRLFARTPRKVTARFRPRVEGLEERVTPAFFYVTNSNDDLNTGSLRWAITQANANPGADTIDTFEQDGFVTIPHDINLILQAALPSITGDLTINGHGKLRVSGDTGEGSIIISGDPPKPHVQVLDISPGVTVNLSGMTITKGLADAGGGIENEGKLTITNCTISDNEARLSGGGIASFGTSSSLTISDSTISGNTADFGGGAIVNNLGTLAITDSTIANNQAVSSIGTAHGGGIASFNAGVTLDGVTLEDNLARGGNGAGGSDGVAAEGGGLYVDGGRLMIMNSTIRSNTAQGGTGGNGISFTPAAAGSDGSFGSGFELPQPDGGTGHTGGTGTNGGKGGDASGGGVFVAADAVNVLGSTISDNAAQAGAGGTGGDAGDAGNGGNGIILPTIFSSNGTAVYGAGGDGGIAGAGGNGGTGGDASGGGLYAADGEVSVLGSTVSDNAAQAGAGGNGGRGGKGGDGGAPGVDSDHHGTPGNGSAGGTGGAGGMGGAGAGGGLSFHGTELTLSNTTVANNQAAGNAGGTGGEGGGGGAGGDAAQGVFHTLGNAGNGGLGGAGGPGGAGLGGGMERGAGMSSVVNATIAYNQAAGAAGGGGALGGLSVFGFRGGSGSTGVAGLATGGGLSAGSDSVAPNNVLLANTIVALNTAGGGAASDVSGTVDPLSTHNLIGTGGAGGLSDGTSGNQVGVADPRLGTLADNGGPTQTIAFLFDSPARDAGDNDAAVDQAGLALDTDQRGTGFARVRAGRVDIGAYELQTNLSTINSLRAAVTVDEGSQAANFGTIGYVGVASADLDVTASVGTITVYADNTWLWVYTPADDRGAPTSVTITATDPNGVTSTLTFGLTVKNVPPTVTSFSVPATATEGDTVTLSAAATDPGVNDTLGYEWFVTDPSGNLTRYEGASVSALLPDDGTYDVVVLVGDGDLGIGGDESHIVVANVAPTIAISGAGTVNAGAAYTLTLGAITDPGTDTVSQYVVHWGDGNSDTYTSGGDQTHVYADGAVTRAISVDLIDEDGTHLDCANPLSVKVNAAPTSIALTANSVKENRPSGTTVGTFSTTDPDAGDTFTYQLVGGDGSTDNGSFTIDAAGHLKTAAGFDYETKSSYSIRVRSTDAGGLATEKAFTINVTNVNEAPTLALPGAQTAYEDVHKAVKGISVGDVDSARLTVTLAVSHGKLTLGTTAGLTVTGNGTGTVSLTGSITNLNAALTGLVYLGTLNYSGTDTLNITAGDGSLSKLGSVALTVKSASQQAADLRVKVNALSAGVLNQSQATRLISDLTLQGNAGDVARVQRFLTDVTGLRNAGVLKKAQADPLLGPGNILLLSVTRR